MEKKSKYNLGDDVFFMENNVITKGFVSHIRTTQYNKYNSEGRLVSDYEKKENVGYSHEYKIICDDFKWYDKHMIDWIDQKLVFSSEEEILQNLLDLRKQSDKTSDDYTDENKKVTWKVIVNQENFDI